MRLMIPALAAASLLGMTLLGNSPSQAQTTKTKPSHTQKGPHAHKAMHAQYECTHCNIMTMKAGKCPVCKTKMTKAAAANVKKAQYGCAHCKILSGKGGKCPVCKMPMKKMAKPAKS